MKRKIVLTSLVTIVFIIGIAVTMNMVQNGTVHYIGTIVSCVLITSVFVTGIFSLWKDNLK